MKTLKTSLTAILMAAGLTLVPMAPGHTQEPASATQAKSPRPDPMRFARGAKAWAENCGRCHNIRSAKEFSDADWGVITKQMRVRANIDGKTMRDIEAFLKASN